MLEYGLWAAGAFAIGVGVVPVVVTLSVGAQRMDAHARGPRPARARARVDRVLRPVHGRQGLYISTTFAIRVEERNLIYLSPVVFAVTARWLARDAPGSATAAAALAVWYLVDYDALPHGGALLGRRPWPRVLSWLNRTWYWTPHDARALLLGIVALGVALLVGREVGRRRRVDLGRWRTPPPGWRSR